MISACPAVTEVKVEPEVICAKEGSATVHITVDWSKPGQLPWDKNRTIKWSYRLEKKGAWSEDKKDRAKGVKIIGPGRA